METILALISVLAAAIAFGQVYLMRSTAHGALLFEVERAYAAQAVRDDRARLYSLAAKPFPTWTSDEYECVERVASLLDQMGFLVKHGYLSVKKFETWQGPVGTAA